MYKQVSLVFHLIWCLSIQRNLHRPAATMFSIRHVHSSGLKPQIWFVSNKPNTGDGVSVGGKKPDRLSRPRGGAHAPATRRLWCRWKIARWVCGGKCRGRCLQRARWLQTSRREKRERRQIRSSHKAFIWSRAPWLADCRGSSEPYHSPSATLFSTLRAASFSWTSSWECAFVWLWVGDSKNIRLVSPHFPADTGRLGCFRHGSGHSRHIWHFGTKLQLKSWFPVGSFFFCFFSQWGSYSQVGTFYWTILGICDKHLKIKANKLSRGLTIAHPVSIPFKLAIRCLLSYKLKW